MMSAAKEEAKACGNPSCNNIGTKKCSVCRSTYYCSRECQRKNWSKHKTQCQPPDSSKINCIKIKAGEYKTMDDLKLLMEGVMLKSYGNYSNEMKELKERFGFEMGGEAKFYGPTGCQWYFFAYTDASRSAKYNGALSMASGCDITGDGYVVRSGPVGAHYKSEITMDELIDAIFYYHDKNPIEVFQRREYQRMFGDAPLPGGMAYISLQMPHSF